MSEANKIRLGVREHFEQADAARVPVRRSPEGEGGRNELVRGDDSSAAC